MKTLENRQGEAQVGGLLGQDGGGELLGVADNHEVAPAANNMHHRHGRSHLACLPGFVDDP
eukprot:6806926-Pyramimonas_sp.AAC.1